MPIHSIPYSQFTAKKTLSIDIQQGILDDNDSMIWNCEKIGNESDARARLLMSELSRFFCEAPQPLSLLSNDDNLVFFLFTQANTTPLTSQDTAEKQLVNCGFNLLLRNRQAIEDMISVYEHHLDSSSDCLMHLERVLLKTLFTPRVAIASIVKQCYQPQDHLSMIDTIQQRQTHLQESLQKKYVNFNEFITNDVAQEEITRFRQHIKTFKMFHQTPIMEAFSEESIDSFFDQHLEDINSSEVTFYSMDENPVVRPIASKSFLPIESPTHIATLNQTPSPDQQQIARSQSSRPIIASFVHNSISLFKHAVQVARGSPMPIMPNSDDTPRP